MRGWSTGQGMEADWQSCGLARWRAGEGRGQGQLLYLVKHLLHYKPP